MPIPDIWTLMLPMLEVAAKGETSVPMSEEEIAARFGLTAEECEQLLSSGGQTRLRNRIQWAKFELMKAGLLESPKRGRFVISDRGRQVLANPPSRLDKKFLLKFPEYKEYQESYRKSPSGQSGGPAASLEPIATSEIGATPDEMIEKAFAMTQAALRADLLDPILQNSPKFFERMIIDLLVAMGYGGSHSGAAEHLGRSGDGGVDGLINEDKLGLDRVYIQAKRYARGNQVGRPDVQAFVGTLVGHGAGKGVFVTTSTFSPPAIDYVRHLQQRVVLIDGERLTALMIDHGVGVRTTRTLEFKRVDEDFFTEE